MLQSNSPSTAQCPTPEEVQTTRYAYLASEKGYKDARYLLDDIASMVARGQVTTLPVCHPALYDQVDEITSEWTFDELHSCASHHRRQCPLSLRELRDQLDKPEYEALRYVLLRLATERPVDSPARRVLKMIGGFDDISTAFQSDDLGPVNPATVFNMEDFEEFWFISPELSRLFNMRESSEISRASRHLSTTHGHYIIRRPATEEDYEHVSRRYSLLYRPASFEEKVRDLHENFGETADSISAECDYSTYEIQQILDKDEVPVLNPFDTTQHSGEVNFEEVEEFLTDHFDRFTQESSFTDSTSASDAREGAFEVTACHIDYPYPYYTPYTPQTPDPHFVPTTVPQYVPTQIQGPVVDTLGVEIKAILNFVQLEGLTVEISTLVEATNSTLKEVLAALSHLDASLLDETLA